VRGAGALARHFSPHRYRECFDASVDSQRGIWRAWLACPGEGTRAYLDIANDKRSICHSRRC